MTAMTHPRRFERVTDDSLTLPSLCSLLNHTGTPAASSRTSFTGIPVVFPCFGPPPKEPPFDKLVQHGFARTSRWNLEKNDDPAVAVFSESLFRTRAQPICLHWRSGGPASDWSRKQNEPHCCMRVPCGRPDSRGLRLRSLPPHGLVYAQLLNRQRKSSASTSQISS